MAYTRAPTIVSSIQNASFLATSGPASGYLCSHSVVEPKKQHSPKHASHHHLKPKKGKQCTGKLCIGDAKKLDKEASSDDAGKICDQYSITMACFAEGGCGREIKITKRRLEHENAPISPPEELFDEVTTDEDPDGDGAGQLTVFNICCGCLHCLCLADGG
uniref:Uncharacterized protein n=1 Tax=Ditylenchus dipsaci TaxID=166011 RepID=A0A915DXY8_9BILA